MIMKAYPFRSASLDEKEVKWTSLGILRPTQHGCLKVLEYRRT
jgi:hypothetical protein